MRGQPCHPLVQSVVGSGSRAKSRTARLIPPLVGKVPLDHTPPDRTTSNHLISSMAFDFGNFHRGPAPYLQYALGIIDQIPIFMKWQWFKPLRSIQQFRNEFEDI